MLADPVWAILPQAADPDPPTGGDSQDSVTAYLHGKGYLLEVKGKKRRRLAPSGPVYSQRTSQLDGPAGHFPFSEWSNVHRLRAADCTHRLPQTMHTAWSNEGIRMCFVLRYSQAETAQVVEHALMTQDILKEYYQSNANVDYTFWLLGRERGTSGYASYQVVYPYIVVQSERGQQLTLSVKERIRTKCGMAGLVQDVFSETLASLAPLYSPELLGEGPESPLVSDTYYVPVALIGPRGESWVDKVENLVDHHLEDVLRETSVVPSTDLGLYTPGFQCPNYEPVNIADNLRSTNTLDASDPFMYKADRRAISRQKGYSPETDPALLRLLQLEIRKYHPSYSGAVLQKAYRKGSLVTVNLASGGQSFCRLAESSGVNHKSNRIYFLVSAKTITQCCYDPQCRAVKRKLAQPVFHKQALSSLLEPAESLQW